VNDGDFSRYGFFAARIKYTIVYNFFDDILDFSNGVSYLLWWVSFFVGVFASWKSRFKGVNLIKRIQEKI